MSMSQIVPDIFISSLANTRIKHVVRLRERRYRDCSNETIIEGFRELTQALRGGHKLNVVFYCPPFFLGENEESLLARAAKDNVLLIETSQSVFEKISYRDRPDGLLGVGHKVGATLSQLILRSDNPLILVTESIEKPGNLGSILRSADGAGLDAVIVCDPKTDINNPNVVRASIGTLFRIPVIESSRQALFSFLQDNAIKWIASSPTSRRMYWEADYCPPVAIVVGSEQYGLDDRWLEDGESVRIPMYGSADSLNVATAASLLIYEAIRQRQGV